MTAAPAFAYPGGKARLRAWLLPFFPASGRTYVEPFAGRANVYFAAKLALRFERWILNDIATAPFLRAIVNGSVFELPDRVDSAEELEALRSRSPDAGRVVSAKVGLFGIDGGKFMPRMVTGSGKDVASWRGEHRRPTTEFAQILLRSAEIIEGDAFDLPWADLGPDDFVYLDPPYVDARDGVLGSIDHGRLLDLLGAARFRWVLSGYDSPLYRSRLGPPAAARLRCNGMRSFRKGVGMKKLECIWRNP